MSGLSSPTLDESAQAAVVNATASSMGISTDYVNYTGSTAVENRRLQVRFLTSTTYTVTAHTSIVIPLINFDNAETLNTTEVYQALVSSYSDAVSSGDFVAYLSAASVVYGSTATANVTVVSHSVSAEVVQVPPPQPVTHDDNTDDEVKLESSAIIGILVGIGGIAILVSVVVYVMRGSRYKAVRAKYGWSERVVPSK